MNKKTKNAIIILTIIMLIAIGLGGYSYAKYITRLEGTGGFDVAKWSFKVNDNSKQIQTIKLTDTVDETKLVDGKIAPGTGGEFTIKIDATGSDVGVKYDVTFPNELRKPSNLRFTYNGQTYIGLVYLQDVISGVINANDTDKIRYITIGWEWPYESGEGELLETYDSIDTQEAVNVDTYTFYVQVTGTQVQI